MLKGKPLKPGETFAKWSLFNKTPYHLLLIAITGFLIYSNTFNVPFCFDDASNIVDNFNLRDLSNFWPPKGSRWVGYFTFALNYYLGGLNVIGYHIVNLIIHILNSILIYFLVFFTFKTPFFTGNSSQFTVRSLQSPNSKLQTPNLIALFSALLFVSHPIQTETVTYIVQRLASLATMFYLLSLVLYIKWKLSSLQTLNTELRTRHDKFRAATRYTLYAFSLISAILAMKTKEISFTLPFIVVLYEFYFFSKSPDYKTQTLNLKKLYHLIPFLLTLLIIPLSIIGDKKPLVDIMGELREASQETEEILRGTYLLTQFRVIVTYIRLLFLPVNQNLDYDYSLSSSFFKAQTFLSFLFLLFIFGFAIYLFKLSRRKDNGYGLLVSSGILWFFITLSVESSIIPIRDIIFEHRLYLPSIGAVIAFSSTAFYVFSYSKKRLGIEVSILPAICILLLITIIPLGIGTYKRNSLWKDETTLWEDVLRKSPNKARGHNNLGNAYYNKGLTDKAIEHFYIALRLKPDYADAHNNLGNAYYNKGLTDRAIEHFHIALRLKPDYADAHNNLGVAYKAKGLTDEAMEHYHLALRQKPGFAEAYNNLGVAYGFKGLTDKAIEHFHIALRLKPDYADAHNNLGVAYKAKGLTDEAIEHYRIALKLKPDFVKVYLNLGLIYLQKGDIEKARREFEMALQIDPENHHARQFLNSIYNLNRSP